MPTEMRIIGLGDLVSDMATLMATVERLRAENVGYVTKIERMKANHLQEITKLKAEVERLMAENARLKEIEPPPPPS